MDTESPAGPRRSPFSHVLFHVQDPLRRMVFALRNLGSPYQRYRHARALHGIRVALAMLTTVLLSRLLDLPHGVWASVSLLAVIGGIQHHGNIRKKAMERGLGTMLGALAGLLLIFAEEFGAPPVVTIIAMCAIGGLCAYYAIGRGGYIALLTAITMVIVGGQGGDPMATGLWRTLQVCIGIAVALAFSFALPLNASYSWRYSLALNLRRAQQQIRRLQTDQPFTPEARSAMFSELSKRSIALRGLMPSAAKEMKLSGSQIERIQQHQRAIVAALEMISNARLHASAQDQLNLSRAFRGSQGQSLRRGLLMIARALRKGDTSVLGTAAGAAGEDGATPSATPSATDPAAGWVATLQGPDWVMREMAAQIEQLRKAVVVLPRQRN